MSDERLGLVDCVAWESHRQVLVEFVQNKAHAVHKAVHICWFAILVCSSTVRCQSQLKRLEILHPLHGEVM